MAPKPTLPKHSRKTPAPAEKTFLALLLALGLWHFHAGEILSGFDLVRGDRGDARFCAFILEHEFKSLGKNESFTSPPYFYPVRGVLGNSETFLALQVPYAFFRSLTLDPWSSFLWLGVACDLLTFGLAFGFLRRGWGAGVTAAWIGAAFFTFNNARFQQTMHLQSQAGFLLPATAWLLAEAWRRIVARQGEPSAPFFFAGLLIALQFLTCFFMGWFFLACLGVFCVLCLLAPSSRRKILDAVRAHPASGPSLLLGLGLGLLPFAWIYLPVVAQTPVRHYSDFLSLMPTPGSWFWMGPSHFPWGWSGPALGMTDPSVAEFELRMGWGLLAGGTVAASGLAALVLSARSRLKTSDTTFPALCAILLAVSAAFVTRWGSWSPWTWVFEDIPGASAIRSAGRIHLVLALPAAVLLAWGTDRLGNGMRHLRGKRQIQARWIVGFFLLFAVWEQGGSPPPAAGFSASRETFYLERLAEQLPKDSTAFYLAAAPQTKATSAELSLDAMWAALLSGVPTLNGYSGVNPPGWDLGGLKRPDYRQRVGEWIRANKIEGRIAELRVGP